MDIEGSVDRFPLIRINEEVPTQAGREVGKGPLEVGAKQKVLK
jgi:hypothetical protein